MKIQNKIKKKPFLFLFLLSLMCQFKLTYQIN